jgi:AraC family transcriptional regulator
LVCNGGTAADTVTVEIDGAIQHPEGRTLYPLGLHWGLPAFLRRIPHLNKNGQATTGEFCHPLGMPQATVVEPLAQVSEAIEFIEANLNQDLRLEVLARRAGISPGHFQRKFRSTVGESPKQFVRRLRMERAARILRGSSVPVTNVAFHSQFESHEGFARAFRARFGMSPTELRDSRPVPGPLPVSVSVVCLPPQQVAYVRHVGPYSQTPALLAELRRWAGAAGFDQEADAVAVFWDEQSVTAAQKTRSQVGLFLPSSARVPEGSSLSDSGLRRLPIRQGEVYPHHVAMLRRTGPYSAHEVRKLYEFLGWHWLPASGWRASASQPPFEIYSGTTERTSPSFSTDVCVPVASRDPIGRLNEGR